MTQEKEKLSPEDSIQKDSIQKNPWALFFVITLSQFLLYSLIQIESYFAYVYRSGDGLGAGVLFLARWPFLQLESLLFALLIGSLAFLVYSKTFLRWPYYVLVGVVSAYVILNQLFYKVFFDHTRLSMTEDRVGDLAKVLGPFWESARAEVDGFFYFNVIFAVALVYGLYSFREEIRIFFRWGFQKKFFWFFPVIYCLSSLGVIYSTENHNLNRHPLFTFLSSAFFPPKKVAPLVRGIQRDLSSPVYGKSLEKSKKIEKLQEAFQVIKKRKRLPNLLLITLESVGSKLILKEGKLSPKHTPYLSALKKHMVIFKNIYTTFPGTSRAHIPLNTGGRTITWSSVYEETVYPYKGPLLARELARKGYETAFFCSQFSPVEGFGAFYEKVGFHKYFDYSSTPKSFQYRHRLNYWGAREEAIWGEALKWIDSRKNSPRPFFLNFISVATHHPYSVPEGYKGPYPGEKAKEKYFNALHYIDHSLGKFLEELGKRKILKDTVIAITADHGEAFEELHRKNFTHKHYLYDENVLIFLILIDLRQFDQGPIYSSRLGSIGDIMPTLLSLVGTDEVDVPGQNLFSDQYKLPLVFFHKSAYPERWGLRDGKWKFIIRNNKTEGEIYDMVKDPDEQANLAGKYPERLERYYDLCASWILAKTPEYRKYLKGFQKFEKDLSKEDLVSPGPKTMVIGRFKSQEDQENLKNFREMKRANPYEELGAWSRWQPYQKKERFFFEFRDPQGKEHWMKYNLKEGWAITWIPFPMDLPLAVGKWEVYLWKDRTRKKKFLSQSFEVDKSVALLVKSEPRIMKIGGFGGQEEDGDLENFTPMKRVNPREKIGAWGKWQPYWRDEIFFYEVKDPAGKVYWMDLLLKSRWNTTWRPFHLPVPMREGRWEVTLYKGRRGKGKFFTDFFVVDKGVPLRVTPGVETMMVGCFRSPEEERAFRNFRELKVVNPREKIGILCHWKAYPKDHLVVYRIEDPEGKVKEIPFLVRAGWVLTHVPLRLALPMKEGKWKVELFDGKKKLLERVFEVRGKAGLERK